MNFKIPYHFHRARSRTWYRDAWHTRTWSGTVGWCSYSKLTARLDVRWLLSCSMYVSTSKTQCFSLKEMRLL